ncbi:MAG: 2-C-methyl-D-erythritol 2,4-cyclodiphosphate synthase [Gammaproteobacteria bacterium]|nr:2-C-methyl-D-erythritol 2,4-cyclodiphosphate synthase [Gammaproteobacteria bacterium]
MKKDSLLAIIAGAGVGSRFESEIPKQYLILNGKSVIERAVEPFLCSDYVKKIIIVISKDDLLVNKQSFYDSSKVEFIHGGEKRANSIMNAIESVDLDEYEYVLTHDAARPNINEKDIEILYSDILNKNSCCAYFYSPVYDSIKKVGTETDKTKDKNEYVLVQTPQISKLNELRNALIKCDKSNICIPDESFAIERLGLPISRILGRRSNIKITEKHDFDLLNNFTTRGGTGFDLHRYEDGSGIILGGHMLECNLQIIAHSDGDVLLHSIADSILGASGQGDIGKYFSDKDPANRGIDSKKIIEFCLESLKDKNLEIYNIDATVICEFPKINPHRDLILKSLSKILKTPVERIGLKATTSEQIGIIGKNKAIAVQSFVNLIEVS